VSRALRVSFLTAVIVAATVGALADETSATQPLPLAPRGQPVPSFPEGAPASSPDVISLDAQDVQRLRAGRHTAGIAMQALDTPWNSLQVEAITRTLAEFGIEVVLITDASQDPTRQAAHIGRMIDRKVSVIFSVPIDPATQAATYRRVSEAGIKLVLMDNVPHGLIPGRDYVTVVASDNESNAVFATEELIQAIGGRGEIGLMTYFYESYYSIAARKAGFEKTLSKYPEVRLVATERFVQPREVYAMTIAMLRANPGLKGIFAVWGDPAMQAVAAAKALGRTDLVVTTNDLGPDTAMHVAYGEIHAIGAQLPYDLGVAEARAAGAALLGRSVPPYISLPAIPVKKNNLISALEQVTKQPAPEALKAACKGECR
jgi:ribose transport system substrate-binding protein